ncbi:MAG TPA: hypothetical protein HPP54_09765 [Nitrospinae bacterium]|nr:hypothetical protein [Nitrospinota bacterium]
MSCYFVIVCKKRSEGEDLIYWRPDRSGYTPNLTEAGRYSGRELEDCAGDSFDWYALKYYVPTPPGQTYIIPPREYRELQPFAGVNE